MSALAVSDPTEAPPGLIRVPGGLAVLPRSGRAVPYLAGRPGRRAATYTRVSADVDGDAAAVARFLLACHGLADGRDLDVVYDFQDNDVAVSGAMRKRRPQYEELLRWVESGRLDFIIAPAQDRIVRRMDDLVVLADALERNSVSLLTTQSGAIRMDTTEGRMTAMIVGSVAEAETRRMGDRLKAKNRQLLAEGWWRGGPAPYGYRNERAINGTRGTIRVYEPEAEVVRRMAAAVLDGSSLYAVALELNADRVPPPSSNRVGGSSRSGQGWSRQSVRRLLLSPTIAGRISVGRTASGTGGGEDGGPGNWTPIIAHEEWIALQNILRDPSRKRRGPTNREYLLSGLVRNHGYADEVRIMCGRTRNGRRCYIAVDPDGVKGGAGATIDATGLERVVVEALLRKADDGFVPEDPATADNLVAIAEAEELRDEIRLLEEARAAKRIRMESFLVALTDLEDRLSAVEARIRVRHEVDAETEQLLATPGALRARWPSLNYDERRLVVRHAIAEVQVVQTTRGRSRWDPERVAAVLFNGVS